MRTQKKYKYKYNTYQKNAILLILLLFLAGGIAGYYNYITYSADDEFDEDRLGVSSEKISEKSIKDVNAELDNLLKQDEPKTYRTRIHEGYMRDVEQYDNGYKAPNRDDEIRMAMQKQAEQKQKYEKLRIEQEKVKIQEEAKQIELIKKQQQYAEEQRRKRYEEQQRQLENIRRNEEMARQNAQQQWSSNNFGQPQPAEMSEEEKAAERMRKDMERQQKLDAIRQKTYTPEQQEKIEECQRREARKQAQLDRRRKPAIKSTHKSLPNFQPQQNVPDQGGCEECARY